MAVDITGTKNQPLFDNAFGFDLAADQNAISNYVAKVGNRRVGTTSERNAATGKDVWEGLLWHDTTESAEYVRLSGSWVIVRSLDLTGAATLGTGWSTPSANVLRRQGEWVQLSFNASRTAALAVGADAVQIPIDFRTSGPNVWGHAWGLNGAAVATQFYYDAASHSVKTNQALASGQSIALSMNWLAAR